MGHNGGPEWNWRADMAGDDAKALEALSRYQSPKDVGKAFIEQRAALSKRAEPLKLADNATPEQVAEYRKGLGVADVAKDAAPEKFIEAYGIKMPEGYQMTEVERGMVGDYAKWAYDNGHSPREVRAATDFFFRQQAANTQALNKINVDKQREWASQLRGEFGKDHDAYLAAGETYLNNIFQNDADAKNAFLNARLPGGGLLGDNPVFVKMMTELAMKNGLTDRIEANALESNGKSLLQQRDELMALRRTNSALYNDPKTQANIDKLNELLLKRGDIDENGDVVQRRRSA